MHVMWIAGVGDPRYSFIPAVLIHHDSNTRSGDFSLLEIVGVL
jgi:hypothetical protein